MVRFYVATTLVRIGEWIAKAAIDLAGGKGHIDIQFEVPLDRPPYKLVGWTLIGISIGLIIVAL